MAEKETMYGGQAVIEGVMMGGRFTSVTAIRRKDGTIAFFEVPRDSKSSYSFLKKWPLVRGVIGIIESSILGSKHLNFSSEKYDKLPEEDVEETEENKGKWGMILGLSVMAILSFLFGKFIFTLLPALAADALTPFFPGKVSQILTEGVLKIILLLAYIYFISITPLMKRVFQYHGAEHKVINAFENDLSLTVENVKKQTRLHYRCGSSFILFTAIISVFLYFFVPLHPLSVRMLTRIALIPVDLGLSYEVLRLTNAVRHIPGLKVLGYPGLWLQLLTTKEPDADQIEVAIAAFNEMKRREADTLLEKDTSVVS
ncbi:DUF1385 domain-containing protein [Pullulanibacillus sp. KACC 23026]|uniref:DUF1385 domain-containing protein n=1 Tax=Pullulanibacillus sp. KACC 23026 TaxID=3028315 RepID=UPI0023B18E9D|nr:DUF1385 domain-containing protein [Pullulanibacillus sp. KACC 23026]WEG14303.1 DUF1385 domain-containing protein [Pullulanibacillus sp. KACC 23026]